MTTMIKLTKNPIVVMIMCLSLIGAAISFINNGESSPMNADNAPTTLIALPEPMLRGEMSLEEAIAKRRSVREFQDTQLTLQDVSQLVWAAQGITDPVRGLRAAPSAGALYPLSVHVAVGNVEDLEPGVYRYRMQDHKLTMAKEGDIREELYQKALLQSSILSAPMVVIIAADYQVTAARYGNRAQRYVDMEAGNAAQNIYLQATARGLGAVVIGAFDDQGVKSTVSLFNQETPLYLMPIGAP